MAIPVSTISVRVIPLLSACSALHGLYEAGTHGAAPTFEHHESFIVSMTDFKKPHHEEHLPGIQGNRVWRHRHCRG